MLKNKLKKQKSLTLNRETVLVLAHKDLTAVAGGFGHTAWCTNQPTKVTTGCGCAPE